MASKTIRQSTGSIFPKGPGKIYFYRYQVEWFAWGGSHLNWKKILNFNPAAGKPFTAENGTENYLSCTETIYPYGRVD